MAHPAADLLSALESAILAGTADGGLSWMVIGLAVLVVGGISAYVWITRSAGVSTFTRGGRTEEELALSDAELVEDEERVLSLLEEHDGQMRQSAIVEETGWSKSKVSMILSEMTDDETVSKLQLGRENLISLPGHEPEAARSPLDESED